MVWLPAPGNVTAQVAVPATESGCAPQPAMVTPPSRKLTVPVGVPEAEPVTITVAVNVTLWPHTQGVTDDVTALLVLPLFTVWVRFGEVVGLKFASPL